MDNGLPRHVAIIMDGNGRWAERRNLPRVAGHRAGVETVREMVRLCASRGIEVLTLFAFSSENWQRPKREVSLLMDLFRAALEQEVGKLHANNVKLSVIGDIDAFSPKLRQCIVDSVARTEFNDGLNLVVAANYGGRWDITQATRRIAQEVRNGDLEPASIDQDTVGRYLSLAHLPPPDLFIRTGGEQRISNFLLWQLAYTELYFTEALWPEFGASQFEDALASFGRRQRRFGRTGQQVAGDAAAVEPELEENASRV
ncbi:MAG: isoprenyl transferase [Gammaproteobacteria bacterium]|nr:isoprenyl transferase [Gammaproteobacteria bacterium]